MLQVKGDAEKCTRVQIPRSGRERSAVEHDNPSPQKEMRESLSKVEQKVDGQPNRFRCRKSESFREPSPSNEIFTVLWK
jgi:hypothetical protein